MARDVLLVDDNRRYLESLVSFFSARDLEVDTLQLSENISLTLSRETYRCIILDMVMPRVDGEEALGIIRSIAPSTPVILNTGEGTIEMAIRCIRKGAFHFIEKEENPERLLQLVHLAMRDYRHNCRAMQSYNLIGSGQRMQQLRSDIARVTQSDATVLVLGESGTGKEHVAGLLHYSGNRAGEAFITLNCAAISESLIESELFGHTRGAFTGAVRDRDGAFIAAHKGTLFLDEIGDMPLAVQTRLLRVLGSGEITRVGETRSRQVDVRIIAATNQDLPQLISSKRFREELYYRLHQIILQAPALREHPEDIPELAQHFLPQANRINNRFISGFSPECIRYMIQHQWPGNVRSLQSAILSAVAFSRNQQLSEADMLQALRFERPASPPLLDYAGQPLNTMYIETSLEEATRAFQKRYVAAALYANHGHRVNTATALGLSRPTFYRLLEKLNIA